MAINATRRSRFGAIKRIHDPAAPNRVNFGETDVVLLTDGANPPRWFVRVETVPEGVTGAVLAMTGVAETRKVAQAYRFTPVAGEYAPAGADRSADASRQSLTCRLEAVDAAGRIGQARDFVPFRIAASLTGVTPADPITLGEAPSFTVPPAENGVVGYNPGTLNNATGTTVVTIEFEETEVNANVLAMTFGDAPTENLTVMTFGELADVAGVPVTIADGRWPAAVGAYVRVKRTVTDPTLLTPLVDYSVWTACADQILEVPPPPAVSFLASVIRYPGYCAPAVQFLNMASAFPGRSFADLDVEWTNTGQSPIPESTAERGVVAVGGSYQLVMADPAKRVDPGLGGKRLDYSVYAFVDPVDGPPVIVGTAEVARAERVRLRWRVKAGALAAGPWSDWTSQLVVPAPEEATGAHPYKWPHPWVPIVSRTLGAYQQRLIDGPGLQFLRDWARTPANPWRWLAPLDINGPRESRDSFGARITMPQWEGMYVGRSGVSAWIDPVDENWQALLYSAASQIVDADLDAWSGFYLSRDGGDHAELTLPLPGQMASTTAGYRHNYRCIAHRPGDYLPGARPVVIASNQRSKSNTAIVKIQIWRSNAGGQAGTWELLADLPIGTFASGDAGVFGIGIAPNGDYYIWGSFGAYRSPAGTNVGRSGTWSKLTTLPADERVHHMDVGTFWNTGTPWSGEVWAGVGNRGLWRAQDGVTFVQDTDLGNVDVRMFDVAPTDRRYIGVVCNGNSPKYSQTGFRPGAGGWKNMKSNPRVGQDDNFSHNLTNGDHYGIICKLDDPLVWFFHRGQHFGMSVDGCVNVDFAGHFMDGSHTHDLGYHPTDWTKFIQAQQDRSSVYTDTAGDWWYQDKLTGSGAAPFSRSFSGNKGTVADLVVTDENTVDFLATHTVTYVNTVWTVRVGTDGATLGTLATGATCTLIPGLSFRITQGATAFADGDRITIAPVPSWAVNTAVNWTTHVSGAASIITPGGRIITMQGHGNGDRVPVLMEPAGDDPLGAVLVKMSANASQLSDWAAIDPNDDTRAFMGKYRVTNIDAALMRDVVFTEMQYNFIGCADVAGTTYIFGLTRTKSDNKIYISSDGGTTWDLWHTAAGSFRPVDNTPYVTPAKHSLRAYAVSNERYLVRIEGAAGATTETRVFDVREYLAAEHADHPKPCVYTAATSHFSDDLVTLSLYMWGVPILYQSQNPRGPKWQRKAGAIGNGSVSGLADAGGALVGRYVAKCIGTNPNSGVFEVRDPLGALLSSNATVGTVYSNSGLTMTIGDGSTDWAIGDEVYLWPRVSFADITDNMPLIAGKVFHAEHNDDVIFGAESGTHARMAPTDHRTAHGITTSYAERARAYLEDAL